MVGGSLYRKREFIAFGGSFNVFGYRAVSCSEAMEHNEKDEETSPYIGVGDGMDASLVDTKLDFINALF